MLQPYDTILTEGQDEIIIQRSRFIGYACPVDTEDSASARIALLRKKYWDATHHVWAYSLGINGQIQRASDDGEPQGTAGVPVLEIINKEGLTDVLIVVIRYFGGTKLGTGGLVRAYTQGAKIALAASGVIRRQPYFQYKIQTNYSMLGKYQREFEKHNYLIQDIQYQEAVTIQVLVPQNQDQMLEKLIAQLSAGQDKGQKGPETYVNLDL